MTATAMAAKPITPNLSVSEQIMPQDIAAIAGAGYKTIICNRPDGEGADQPAFAEIEAAARATGMTAAYLPIVSGMVGDADATAFGALLDRLPNPVFAFCPLTVERGKIMLAEFGYGGTLLPSFPAWMIDGTKPSKLAWLLKEQILPPVYWKAMLRGREWMAKPQAVSAA